MTQPVAIHPSLQVNYQAVANSHKRSATLYKVAAIVAAVAFVALSELVTAVAVGLINTIPVWAAVATVVGLFATAFLWGKMVNNMRLYQQKAEEPQRIADAGKNLNRFDLQLFCFEHKQTKKLSEAALRQLIAPYKTAMDEVEAALPQKPRTLSKKFEWLKVVTPDEVKAALPQKPGTLSKNLEWLDVVTPLSIEKKSRDEKTSASLQNQGKAFIALSKACEALLNFKDPSQPHQMRFLHEISTVKGNAGTPKVVDAEFLFAVRPEEIIQANGSYLQPEEIIRRFGSLIEVPLVRPQ